MNEASTIADLAAIARLLPELAFGRPLTLLEVTSSTNDVARRLADDGAPHGATVIADRQTAGRGSHGRHWHSPPGANLHVSVILRLAIPAARLPLISLALGLAVCDAVESVSGLPARVKWPNDVWIDGRKVAGILVEASSIGGSTTAAIAGIGIDVNLEHLPDDLSDSATSMRRAAGRPFDRAAVLVALLSRIDHWTRALESGADVADALAGRAALVGESATFDDEPCVVDGIEHDGALRIRTARGIERRWSGQLRQQR